MNLSAKRLTQLFFVLATFILAVNVVNKWMGEPFWNITRLIDFDTEGNLPTWFSSILWFMVSLTALRCSQLVLPDSRSQSHFWKFAAFIFLLFSFDEVAQIHEHLGGLMTRRILHGEGNEWAVFLGPFLCLFAVAFITQTYRFLRQDKKATAYMVSGIVLFVISALFFEMIGTFINKEYKQYFWSEHMFEEYFEMMGVILLFYGARCYAQRLE